MLFFTGSRFRTMEPKHRVIAAAAVCMLLGGAACWKDTLTDSAAGEAAGKNPGTADADRRRRIPHIREEEGLTTVAIVQKLAPSIVRVQAETASGRSFRSSNPEAGVGTDSPPLLATLAREAFTDPCSRNVRSALKSSVPLARRAGGSRRSREVHGSVTGLMGASS